MKKLIVIFLLSSSFLSFSQTTDTTKRTIIVDENLIDLIQLLHPEFFYSSDSVVFRKNLEKHFINEMYSANKAIELDLKNDSVLLANKDIFLELAENMYWASVINKTNTIEQEITDEECHKYYIENKDSFITTYVFDYWQAWIRDSEEEKDALKQLNKLSKLDVNENQGKLKISDASYAINIEFDREILANHDYYSQLLATNLNTISKAIIIGESTVYLIPVKKSGGKLMDFESVKEICRQNLMNIKQKELEIKKEEDIRQMFDIIISDDFENRR